MPFGELNFIAILSAAISSFVIAGLWYSNSLFAKDWMTENNFTAEDLADPKPAMIKSFIATLLLAFGLAILLRLAGITGWLNGAAFGAIVAIFVHGAASFPNYAFENKSLRLFMIHMGNSIFGLMVMGAILAGWS
ncbi:MAG: DUF1761 domain-containing protein [Proteobacteria bacterium]|nr:DUF1761 domain-containing protein [Pseudomonadota bacterium]